MDKFEGVLPHGIMAVNLAGNYKPPHLARVNQVTETFCNVQWLKGIYKRKWVCGWSLTQIPKGSVIYFDIQFHENYKLTKEAARYLRKRYRELARELNRFTLYCHILTNN